MEAKRIGLPIKQCKALPIIAFPIPSFTFPSGRLTWDEKLPEFSADRNGDLKGETVVPLFTRPQI